MKRHIALIASLAALITLICSDSITAYDSSDIRPANEYSDPADYELIIIDNDGWELRMNTVMETGYTKRYKGILIYGYGGASYTGELRPVYYKLKERLLITCTDSGWHDYTLSYSLQYSDDSTYIDRKYQLSGLYLYFETGSANTIGADIVKGAL